MSNYNETISGEIALYNNNAEPGLSGQSPDWGGGQPASFTIYWRNPGGITNVGWPTDEGAYFSEIDLIVGDTSLSEEQKREKINELVYKYGNIKLSGEWETFRDHYINLTPPCLSIP